MAVHDTEDTFDLNRIISQGWKLYLRNFTSIAATVLLVSVPVNAALSFLPVHLLPGHGPYDAWVMRLLSSAKLLVFNGLIAMAVSKIVETSATGIPISWSSLFRHALSRLGAALSPGPLLALSAIGMLLLLLVPRVGEAIYYALFTFHFIAVSLRGRSGMAAIDYSRGLFAGRFGKVFWSQLVFFLFPAALTAAMLPFILVLPRTPAVATALNALLDLFLAWPFAMSTLLFLGLESPGMDKVQGGA
ncbi:MAG: hypothetical protein HGB04_08345 [Chlorobiaceae bacterium]|nr:hypothetical protein [Chlorobiaceae bacterium]